MTRKNTQHTLDDKFLTACENGDVQQAKRLLEKGSSSSARNTAGETALHLGVKSGNNNIVRYLAHELRLDTNAPDAFGRTPLHWAAQQGNMQVVETLLLAHADIGAKDEGGVEPQVYAETNGHLHLKPIFTLARNNTRR